MASANSIVLLGRLTRDIETRSFNGGGKVAKFGFAVDGERRKDQSTGKWKSDPVFLDCEVFNRGETGKQADTAEQYLSKGKQVYIRGHLKMDQWKAQDGSNRSKLVVVVDEFQMIGDGKQQESSEGYQSKPRNQGNAAPQYAPDDATEEPPF